MRRRDRQCERETKKDIEYMNVVELCVPRNEIDRGLGPVHGYGLGSGLGSVIGRGSDVGSPVGLAVGSVVGSGSAAGLIAASVVASDVAPGFRCGRRREFGQRRRRLDWTLAQHLRR